jgi:hypothetical protein
MSKQQLVNNIYKKLFREDDQGIFILSNEDQRKLEKNKKLLEYSKRLKTICLPKCLIDIQGNELKEEYKMQTGKELYIPTGYERILSQYNDSKNS